MYHPRHLFSTVPPVTSAARNQPRGDFIPGKLANCRSRLLPTRKWLLNQCLHPCPTVGPQTLSALPASRPRPCSGSLSWTQGDFRCVHTNPTLTRGLQALRLITVSLLFLKCILGCVTWNSGCPGHLQGGGEDTSSHRSLGPKPQGPCLVSGDEFLRLL